MTQITINHDGSIANIEAMEACIIFTERAFFNRSRADSIVNTSRGNYLKVSEREHENQANSICSVIFDIEKIS